MNHSTKCVLTINLSTIKNNYHLLQKFCQKSEVGASVKANCYGLGMEKIAPILEGTGCKNFFVANKYEGISLRNVLKNKNSNIYILNGYFSDDKKDFIEHNLIPVINSKYQFDSFGKCAEELNQQLKCVVHINTGMNRLGMSTEEASQLHNKKLDIICVMSHLSSSEDNKSKSNEEQLIKFQTLSKNFPNSKKSLANSGGIFLGKDYHFDITRPGAALYGINPAPYLSDTGIRNPITLMAPIIQISKVLEGDYIGYNRTYQADKNLLIATLPIGYADGYLRALSNKGIVFINNREAPVVGRVSMDLITVDVTNIPAEDLFLGQQAEIIGPNITPDKIAELANTNTYEILTAIGNRYKIIYCE